MLALLALPALNGPLFLANRGRGVSGTTEGFEDMPTPGVPKSSRTTLSCVTPCHLGANLIHSNKETSP